MIPKAVKRRVRPLWLAAAASAGWSNRADIKRWVGFVRHAATERPIRPMADLLTEARTRAAISADPLLRRDRSITDLSVHDGVVTLHTTGEAWPDSVSRISKLKRVKGIDDVVARPVPSTTGSSTFHL